MAEDNERATVPLDPGVLMIDHRKRPARRTLTLALVPAAALTLHVLRPAEAAGTPGLACDGREWTDLTFAAGGHTVTSAHHRFTHADTGKLFAGAYESGGDPAATRTITAVDDATGTATLSGGGFSGSKRGDGAAFIGTDDSDALQQEADTQTGSPEGRPAIITLPPGKCLFSHTVRVTETNGLRLTGAGRGLTMLLTTSGAGALAIIEKPDGRSPDGEGAAAVLSGFSIVKLPRANKGARFAGTALYVGNPDPTPGRPASGHTVVNEISVQASTAGDGWSVGFDGDNLSNAFWSDLQVDNPGGEVATRDIPMPATSADAKPPEWKDTAATGRGTSYYWHGSHGGYAIDSTFLGLVSVGGESAFDFRDVQGVHIIAAHFIASAFGIRELTPERGKGDELFSLHDSLVQSRYRDLTIVGSTDNEIGGNLFWGYGNPHSPNPAGWIGLWLTGYAQSTTFNNNVLVDADPLGWGVYDCMHAYAHTIDSNSFEYLKHGIVTCPGEGSGAMVGNTFAGIIVPNTIDNHGSNAITGNNRSGADTTVEQPR